MNSIRFAAIDIGSNAVRLLIMSVSPEDPTESFTKELMIRVPLRLGQESFVSGKIDEKKSKKLIRLMKAFRHLMKVYEVDDYRVCATAAMREAKNAKEIVKEIKDETELKIEIIDGHEEAIVIYESHFAYHLNESQNYVFVDVGGGSTEISLISNGELIQSNSYNIGTVRLLNNRVKDEEYERLHTDLSLLKEQYPINDIIGSGGNIIKLNSLAKVRRDRKLSLVALENLNEILKQYTVDELIEQYKLKPDRADIITHAAGIYIDVAKSLGAKSFIVPKIGLIDGIIHMLYVKWKSKKKNNKNTTDVVETPESGKED
ncbi:MAG: ethanolamine ammonia-lyase reactivating factor EutA [Paludibacter sp.]|nr:ethanolamine ammonia-lyase reactivating factor EutA [Paludibacter sp.]